MLCPELGRRTANDGGEGAAEGTQAGEPDVPCDVGDASVGLPQQRHGPFDPTALEVAVWRLAVDALEDASELRGRQMRDGGERGHRQRLGVVAVHRISGPQHAPMGVLACGHVHIQDAIPGRGGHRWPANGRQSRDGPSGDRTARLVVVRVVSGQCWGVNRTDRLYALVEELRAAAPDSRSSTWLAARFEVSGRTIERDLSALQQSGVPIYATPGRRGGYAIDVRHTLPPLNLSAAEVAAVATALAADTSTPFTQAGRSALQKMMAVLGEVDAAGVRDLTSRVRLYDRAHPAKASSTTVERAIIARRVLGISYRDKDGEVSARSVEPVAVLGVQPHWYLWGWCRLREAPRSFRLDRIEDAVMTDEVMPDRGLDPASLELTELIGRGILGT